MLLGTSHLCNLDRFISWTYLLIISQGAKVSESTIAAIESTSITQRCQRNSFPAPASQCAKAQDRLVSQWLLTAGGKTKICGIQSPNPAPGTFGILWYWNVQLYIHSLYILYIYRDHLIHMLGYTVLTKVDKIGLVGNWIPVLKQLTSDYTCQICTQTAAKCNLGFHKIDRLVRTQRESSLECKHECKPYRCLHWGNTERWTDCSPTCDHLASRV